MRHRGAGWAGLLAVGLAVWGQAVAQEIVYRGEWACEAIPSANLPPFRGDAIAVRDGSRLTVTRPVYLPQTRQEIGRETGTTTIRDGRFQLETSSTQQQWSVNGRFAGRATDTEIAFEGTQTVQQRIGGGGERRCRVRLTRQ